MALPAVRSIGARIDPGLSYAIVFAKYPNTLEVGVTSKAIYEAFNASQLGVVVRSAIRDGVPLLTVKPEIDPNNAYAGLKILQGLLKPEIPRTAIVYIVKTTHSQWRIQMSVLGGGVLLNADRNSITKAIADGGAKVADTVINTEQQATVFYITVPARGVHALHEFLDRLQNSCGIFMSLQL